MKALFCFGLLGLAGVACLATIHLVAYNEGSATTPLTSQLLTSGCWFSLGAGVVGAIGGAVARKRRSPKSFTTLIISLSVGVVMLAIWTRVKALPNYIRSKEPMRVKLAVHWNTGLQLYLSSKLPGTSLRNPSIDQHYTRNEETVLGHKSPAFDTRTSYVRV
jgi:hypothetical protein